jgi:signal transduction histidine kinase
LERMNIQLDCAILSFRILRGPQQGLRSMDSLCTTMAGHGPRSICVPRGRRTNGRASLRRSARVPGLLAVMALALAGCARSHDPAIIFTRVPLADHGGPDRIDVITGRVHNARPGQRIVVYALADNRWYVQPLVETPFTRVQPDNTWTTATHLGSEYAALLVEPGYQPALQLTAIPQPSRGVAAVAVRAGRLRIGFEVLAGLSRMMNFGGYDSWWFRVSSLLVFVLAFFGLHRFRMYQMTRMLNARFQERLAERTRIAQELHDTLLQGFLSASMQVDVAEDQLPDDSPAKPMLRRALQLMREVTEEGRHVIRGLRLPANSASNIEEIFSLMGQEMMPCDQVKYSVVSDGNPRPLRPAIRDEVRHIGREALANAFKHARALHVQVEIEYASAEFRMVVQDDGCGIDPVVLHVGRQDHWGLPGMRERAEGFGATLKLRSRLGDGTEVELSVPGGIAYQSHVQRRTMRWPRWMQRNGPAGSE